VERYEGEEKGGNRVRDVEGEKGRVEM